MSLFTGSGVAITTPFDKNGRINFDALKNHIEFLINNETDAIIVAGTTGEGATLSEPEHLEVVKFTVNMVNKRIPVIAGTGSNNTAKAVALTEACTKLGVDGFLVVTSYYNKGTQKGLIEHFTTIANVTDLPIILYNVPGRTNVNLEPETVFALSKVKNIVGIKEASGDISQVAKIANLCGPDFAIYSGNDDQIVPLMSLGGVGVISVLANVVPKETHDIVYRYLSGDIEGSLQLQLKYLNLIDCLFSEVNPIPVKSALNLMGIDAGYLRLPLTTLEEDNFNKLKQEMINLEIIQNS